MTESRLQRDDRPARHQSMGESGAADSSAEDTPLFRAMLGEAWHRNSDDSSDAPRNRPELVLPPSTLRAPSPSRKLIDPDKRLRWVEWSLCAGIHQLVAFLMGSAVSFLLGSMLVTMLLAPAIFVGVLLMLAGLCGTVWAMVLLRRWRAEAGRMLDRRTRIAIRVLGVVATGAMFCAFSAAMVPRGLWPI